METSVSYDIAQYVKYFDNLGYEFDIVRKAGQWSVTVWGFKDIRPVTIKNVKIEGSDGAYYYENGQITKLRDFVARSEPRDLLGDALLDVYRVIRLRTSPQG